MALARWNPPMPWRPSQEPWSPFTGMESLRAEMDHLFNAFLGTMPSSGANASLWYPRVDLREHDQEFVLVADLPGMQQDDIQITVENNILTLQGKRRRAPCRARAARLCALQRTGVRHVLPALHPGRRCRRGPDHRDL